jgi:hypothetical protein
MRGYVLMRESRSPALEAPWLVLLAFIPLAILFPPLFLPLFLFAAVRLALAPAGVPAAVPYFCPAARPALAHSLRGPPYF